MKLTKRKKNIITTALLVSLLLLFEAALLLFSAFYQEISGYPRIANGVMDFTDYQYRGTYMGGFPIQGEWDFFYNKWIVTDGFDGAPDAKITLPGVWTGLKADDGARLPKTGYASYRVTIAGLKPGDRFRVVTYNSPGAYRVFINGQLNTVSGRLSKNSSETFSSGRVNEAYPYTAGESGFLTVVVEISATSDGGLFDVPALAVSGGGTNQYDRFYTILSYMVIGMIVSYVIFSFIINFGLYRKQKRFSSSLLLLTVFLHYFTSKEVYYNFAPFLPFINYAVIPQINFITGVLVIAAFVFHLLREKSIAMPKAGRRAVLLAGAAFIVLYYILRGTRAQAAAVFLSFAPIIYILYLLSRAITDKTKFSVVNTSMLLFLTALVTAEALDSLQWLVYTMQTPTSVILLLFVISVTAMNFIAIKGSAEKALSAAVLEKENELIKHKALRAQIKPHFIFNTLASIQSLYKEDAEGGDEALTKFASHLRQNIDADNRDLIPFEQELKNIENYAGLESLRESGKAALLFDIDFADFEVPVLSLQPLVENAIKHAGIRGKDDNYVRITSRLENGAAVIEVADNGAGFDAGSVRKDAAGLKNCAGRFKYLLNADLRIDSVKGRGTVVTVRIPLKAADGSEAGGVEKH